MEIFLYRHAATSGNLEKRYIGSTDEALCPEGREQAAAIGWDASVDTVIVSGLRRTLETAAIWFPAARQIEASSLREMRFGAFEGHSFPELRHDPAYNAWLATGCEGACPGGESMAAFTGRVRHGFAALVEDARRAGICRLVIVAHGGTLMAVMSRHARPARSYFDWHTGHCRGFRAVIDEAAWDTAPVFTTYTALMEGGILPCQLSGP